MFRQQPPLKVIPSLSSRGSEVRKPPNFRRRHNPYDPVDQGRRNKSTGYDEHWQNVYLQGSPTSQVLQYQAVPGPTWSSQDNDGADSLAAATQNTTMGWGSMLCPPRGEAVVLSFGGDENQWTAPPRTEQPTFTQDEWGYPVPPDKYFPFQGAVDLTSPSISTGPSLHSQSSISPRLYNCTTSWDPVVASIPYQARFSHDTPMDHPYPQSRLHVLERGNPSRDSSNYSAPSNPSGEPSQSGPTIYVPDPQATFPPPPTDTPQASRGVIDGFDHPQQLQAPGSANVNPNWAQPQYGREVMMDGGQVDSRVVETRTRTVKPATIPKTGQSQGSNTRVDLAPSGSRSFSSPTFSAQTGGTPGIQNSYVPTGSTNQRAQSEESFFFKNRQLSQPPPIVAPRVVSTTMIDTPLKKSQQGTNSRYEQSSTYAMLWPPPDIQGEPGDLFVNTDSVTSGSHAWISDGATWTPIAHP